MVLLKQNPPIFDGIGEPAKAETWICALERIINVLMCNNEERMTCVTYGSADIWWDTKMKTTPRDQVGRMTWENFKEEIYIKYVSTSYRKAKAAEFYNLTQGRMSVTEYDRTLCDITQYAPEQVDTEYKLAERFRESLRHEIKMALASRGILTCAGSLTRVLDVEEAMPKERAM
ncbi:uncharacterized protein LOC121804122 [Salvia splendens]|uniref:uncharacterized protein LOC121804122 n=1 Tax=Salvia splendens TaxID=180675 RepID=UPI001C251806|nr:uncharacterized protein LOC121804122 [Salvia splendens]